MPEEAALVEDIAKTIAAIQPRYAENKVAVLRALAKGLGAGAAKAKPLPAWSHSLVYDSTAQTLEPVYFWIIDFMKDIGFKTEKIIDNFAASPGSGYFAELAGRATRMQQEGMRILREGVYPVVRGIITLLYDLKEFEIRLKQYDLASSKKPEERESGLLGLKQIWMDKVDMQRGKGSINAMTYELGFATLRDAFMAAKSPEEVDKMDLNDRVKRVLKPRIAEFLEWRKRSEAELRKRFEIERSYLKSQVGSLKLYTRWAKPYLKAAEQLMMKEKGREPALVKAFNTIILELTLLGRKALDIAEEVDLGNLPKAFRDLKLKRKYYACALVDFIFRGIPSRTPQGGYIFGGRVDVSWKAFSLNDDELRVLDSQLKKSDFEDALKFVEITTEESLEQITADIEHFLGKEKKEEKPVGLFARPKKEEKKPAKPAKKEGAKIKADSYEESVIRQLAEQRAAELCFKIYDIYKKAHQMASFAEPEWIYPPKWRISG